MLNSLILFFANYGFIAVFCMLLLCGFGVPIPEDVILAAGGVMCGTSCQGAPSVWAAFIGCGTVHLMLVTSFIGVLLGDLTMFTLGRKLGFGITRHRWFKRVLSEKRFDSLQRKVTAYGNWILFAARFTPGLRSPLLVVAGISRKVSYKKLLIIDGTAALLSIPVWISIGFVGARNSDVLTALMSRGKIGMLVVLGILLVLFSARIVLKRR